MPKTPPRPIAKPGVPVPTAYTGPSRNLQSMATQIGRDKALSEFYKALVQEQWEYDNDFRQATFDAQRDNRRYEQEIGIQDHREYLKTGTAGLGVSAHKSLGVSNPSKVEQMGDIVSGRTAGSMQEASQGSGQDTDAETKAAAIKSLQKTKEQVDAEKKAARDEEEADWWGKVKDFATAEPDWYDGSFLDSTADSTKEEVKDIGETSAGKVAIDVGGKAIEQLSRPNHAIASAAMAWNEMDDDPGTKFGLKGFFGQRWEESLDDLSIEGIKNVGSKFMEGLKLENDTTFSDVIQRNAEFDPSKSIHDTLNYQMLAGIGGDIVLDPLNLVGVGIVSKPLKIAKEAKNASRVTEFANEVAGFKVPKGPRTILNAGEDHTYSANEIVEMLGGGKRYNSRAEQATAAKKIQENVVTLSQAIDRAGTGTAGTTRKGVAIHKAATRVRAQLDAEKSKFASAVVTEKAMSRSAKEETNGSLPVGTTKALATRVEQQRIIKAMGEAKYKDPDKFNESLGEAWAKHPALNDADRKELFESNRFLTKKAYPAESARNSALINQVTERKKVWEKTKGPEAKAAYERAKVALARDNKKFNRLRADTFMRSARARINKNLGTQSSRERELSGLIKASSNELEELGLVRQEDGNYVGTADDRIAAKEYAEGEFAEADISDVTAALESDLVNFSSRERQLQAVFAAATREDKNLYPDFVGADELDTPIMEVPDRLQDSMGDLDTDLIKRALVATDDDLKIRVRGDITDPAMREWLEDFAEAFNSQWDEEFSRLNQNAQRGANEIARSKGIAEVIGEHIASLVKLGDEDAKHFTEIFRNPDGSAIDLKDAAKKFAYPSFETKGKRIFQNSKELAKMVDAPAMSRTEKMRGYLDDPTSIKAEKDTEYIYERLREFGLPVVNNPEAIHNYVTLNNKLLRETFEYKNIIFAMRFKKAHGIPLEDAMELRSSILGNTVKSNFEKSTWAKNYPKGMSKARFLHEVTGSSGGASLKRVLDGAPFRITPKKDELGFTSPTNRPMSNSQGGWKWLYEHGSDEQLQKALDEAGLPSGATLDDVSSQWYDDMHVYLTGLEPDKLKYKLTGIWESSHGKQVTARKQDIIEKSLPNRELESAKSRKENITKARDTAFNKVVSKIEQGKQTSQLGTSMVLPHTLDELETAKSVYAAKREQITEQIDDTRVELQAAKEVHNTAEIARLEKRLARLKVGIVKEKQAIVKDLKEAREAKKDIQARLREEAILSVANAEVIAKRKGLALNAVGKQLTIPTTRTMFAAAEKAGGLPVINKFFELYKGSFASQAGLLPKEMLYIRNRAISDPSKVIGEHIRLLKGTLGQVPIKARAAATREFTNGVDNETTQLMDNIMGDSERGLLPYFQNKVPVGEDVLTVRDINAYLPEEFRVKDEDFASGRQLLSAIMADDNGVLNLKRDPLEAIWVTRIAVEQAMARKAMIHSLNETFGVKRGYKVSRKNGVIIRTNNGQALNEPNMIDGAARDTIEKLKDEGWITVQGMGHTHYFPKDTAESVSRLLEMFKPENVGKVGKLIDEATGIWKTSVTIYNIPGYYIRNGMGEVMSAWLAGVNSAKPYYKSAHVWRYVRDETKNAEALAQMKPELGLVVETKDQLGKRHVVTLQNGTSVDVARVHELYREHGLATGFINTEYRHHYNKTKERLHSIKGVQKISNANEGLREFNENYEDFYRMAHFIDKLGKAPKNMSEHAASEWAAADVRKFHFDYTDFTHTEKARMLRVFPFYKWTRKALPLMSSMMFAKPGKMMAYPKMMEGLSEGLVNSDDLSPGEDHNGFMPNFHGVVPPSIAEMWSYQVGGETGYDAKGEQDYFRMSTPQMDSMNALSNPVQTGEGLLNPLIKGPVEQLMGETIGMGLPVANKDGIVDGEEVGNDNPSGTDKGFINERMGHLLRMFPPGALAANYEQGVMDDDAWIRLLSGMGYRQVSEEHRNMLKGEGFK